MNLPNFTQNNNNPGLSPTLSVVMAVKNGGSLIKEAIDSILGQTFGDFELIVINDGSDDNTLATLEAYTDPRIQVLTQENQGISKTANRGFALARGKYITRHDHDDISFPSRFAKQVAFLDAHPQIAYLGTRAEIWNLAGPTGKFHDHPSTSGLLALDVIFDSPFVLSSCMFRKEVLQEIGMYTTDPQRYPMEDFEFAARVIHQYQSANLPERLLAYRETPNSESSSIRSQFESKRKLVLSRIALFSSENLAFASGLTEPNRDTHNFGALSHDFYEGIIAPLDYGKIRSLLTQAAKQIAIEFKEPAVHQAFNKKLQHLDYQYYTWSGQKYHWQRLLYLLQNRSFIDHWHSVKKVWKNLAS